MTLSVHDVEIRQRLLRAIDRRDPWEAKDFIDWLKGHYPERISGSEQLYLAAADFADEIAREVADDPAFPKIVDNLLAISAALREQTRN